MKERLREIKATDQLLLISILIAASVLRLRDLGQLPFMHDELSALIRADAGGFGDALTRARTTDVHPVGVHLFLYFWQNIVGSSEALIKLPFILFSIGAIYYAYRIAAEWFSSTTALITCSFMACLQLFVMYGELARPYASGLFFCLWFIWHWNRLLFSDPEDRISIWGFVCAGTLACYNHYFSLLFVGIAGAAGLLLMSRHSWKKYLWACFYCVLFFLPHIGITVDQLGQGEDQSDWWIAMPESDWLYKFGRYLFHYSRHLYALAAVLAVCSLVWFNRKQKVVSLYRVICLVFGISSFVVIYFYSREKQPVLQLSSMTFSVPFLLMLLFSFYGEAPLWFKTSAITGVLVLSLYTLVQKRGFYKCFYNQPYEQMAVMTTTMNKEAGEENVMSFHQVPEGFMDYYKKKYGEFGFIRAGRGSTAELRDSLLKRKVKYVVAGNLDGEQLAVIREYYPFKVRAREGFTCAVYCFSALPGKVIEEKVIYESSIDKRDDHWSDTLPAIGFPLNAEREFSPLFQDSLKNMVGSRYDDLLLEARLAAKDTAADLMLVLDIHCGTEVLTWRSSSLKLYHKRPGTARVYLAFPLRDLPAKKLMDSEMKVYVWNPKRQEATLSRLSVRVTSGNKYAYGLYEDF